MKKRVLISFLLICILMLASCTDQATQSTEEPSQSDNLFEQNAVVQIEEKTSVVPAVTSTSADIISDKECEVLASKMYNSILAIATEFYGLPIHLSYEEPKGGYSASETVYAKVIERVDLTHLSLLEFKNDEQQIRNILTKYLSEGLIESAFSLKAPCPIYSEDGVLFRTIYEPTTGNYACDISGGRIISRENSIVRYAFPIYYVNYDTNAPIYDEGSFFGYFDFIYENGAWKVNDFRLEPTAYSYLAFPCGKADITKDAFYGLGDKLESNGTTVTLNGGKNVVITHNGKSIDTQLKNDAAKIKAVIKNGNNIFISFVKAFDVTETVIYSTENESIITSFVSNGFCVADNGDWYYATIDYENYTCNMHNKDGEVIVASGVVRQEKTTNRALLKITPIDEIKINESGFEIYYDTAKFSTNNE